MSSSNTSGVGGSGSVTPSGGSTPSSGVAGQDVEAALHTPVSNLGQLKALLTQTLGEQEGNKLYNSFITSFAMIMIQQMQDSAQQAQNAAQNMRMDVQ